MGKPEAYVENYLKTQAERHGFLCYKFQSGVNGVPDRIVIGNGYTIFVETKRLKEHARRLQTAVIQKMRNRGAFVYVIDNRPDVDELLNCMKNKTVEAFISHG